MNMRFLFLLMGMLALSGLALGQNFDKFVAKGSAHYSRGEINQSLAAFKEAEKLEPGNVELNLHMGKAYLLSDYKHKSLEYLVKVYKLAPTLEPHIRYMLGLACQYNYMFSDAIEHYEAYAKQAVPNKLDVTLKIRQCQYADEVLQQPVAVDIENLGPTVNSPEHEYSPIITPNQSVLVFTSRRDGSTGGKKTQDNENFEDIYISYRRGDTWTPPKQISKNINFDFHDAAAALTTNGRELYLYIEENGGDLYHSSFNGQEWSKPKALGAPINTPHHETSITVTKDGKRIYFASDRPGGFGNLDIYMSDRQSDGSWGTPVNMGPTVNTSGNEDSPFIHPDGQTLYFSSDGHLGLGGYDVFRSEWTEGGWQKPVNMGYPINTPDDNFHFIMAENRVHGYYTSVQEGGVGKADIYRVTFLDEKMNAILAADRKRREAEGAKKQNLLQQIAQQQQVVVYEGIVRGSDTNKPLQAIITAMHYRTGEVVARTESDAAGNYRLEITEAGDYALSVEAQGYLILSRTLKIPEQSGSLARTVPLALSMKPIQVGISSIMANIFFDFGKASLRTESIGELERIRDFLQNSPKIKIQINGHTDNVGDPTYNKQLSLKRAEAVMNYLLQNGVSASRLTVMGYGQERPIVSNDDEEGGRAMNRRTEIEVVSY
ncbi:Root adhesin [Cesiribacter andamanensis AMV16]|uniref:Root adhesin n=2 Tax=Cesiribacter TaxID=1133570 RepID=M7NBK1_9BACT|nr:Root adhesin [Cesiribacter andamanensis AMV16]